MITLFHFGLSFATSRKISELWRPLIGNVGFPLMMFQFHLGSLVVNTSIVTKFLPHTPMKYYEFRFHPTDEEPLLGHFLNIKK